jgi:5-formyltetrahydrofolate cyclo-ligase
MKTLRQTLRQKRRALSKKTHRLADKSITRQVQKSQRFMCGQKVAIYLPNDGEIITKGIIYALQKLGVRIYLPRLNGKKLLFSEFSNTFKINRFGILESTSKRILSANQLSIIFMPLVGFDIQKNRIGMGGGFYDRTLAFKKYQKNYQNPHLIGLAFEGQKCPILTPKSWDIRLNKVITPAKIYP